MIENKSNKVRKIQHQSEKEFAISTEIKNIEVETENQSSPTLFLCFN